MNGVMKPDGTVIPLDRGEFTVGELQDMVGGFIDVERIGDGYVVHDPEASYKGRCFNPKATSMVLEHLRDTDPENADSWDGMISGDAVICEKIKVD